MLIDWNEVQRITDEAAEAKRAKRARELQLRAKLAEVWRSHLRPTIPFPAYTPPPPVARINSPAERLAHVGALLNNPKVRQVVRRELDHLDRAHRSGFAAAVADELEDDDSTHYDPEAARRLRMCDDPNFHAIGLHVHPAENGEHTGAVMVKVERRRCWLRNCPKCAKDHAARLRARYEGRIWKVVGQNLPGCELRHVVLTMPRSIDLRGDLAKLHRCAKKLRQHFWGRHGQGAFATAEVGPKGHQVHVHMIVYGGWVRQAELSDYWRKLTGNAFVTWIKRIKPSAAVREGIKYVTKLAKTDGQGGWTMHPADVAELHCALKGRRRVWAWGAFYGLADDDKDQAPADDAGEPKCRCGAPMVFLTVPEARALLHSKGANNCLPTNPLGGLAVPGQVPRVPS